LWYRRGSGSRAAKQAWQHVRQHAEPTLSWLHMSRMPPTVLSQWQAGWPLRAELAGPGWRFRAEVAAALDSSESIRYSRRARGLAKLQLAKVRGLPSHLGMLDLLDA